ncbi:MAG: DNA-directed RNA polymerase subunit K [Candidatus Jordarchaeaceae archaeon]
MEDSLGCGIILTLTSPHYFLQLTESQPYTENVGKHILKERYDKTNSKKEAIIGPPKLTRFEKARIIGARALQIAMGAPILVQPTKEKSSPIDIAIEELNRGVLPITIRRTLPDGVTSQDIPIKWLL